MIIKKKPSAIKLPQFQKLALLLLGFVILGAWWQKDFILINFLSHGVTVSPKLHFYSQPAKVSLSTLINGEIFYTTDGSEPTADAERFEDNENSILISESTSLRYAVFKNGQQVTRTQSHDILINAQHELPVMTITTAPENLWDPEKGIYVEGNHNNIRQSGAEWERSAELSFYDKNQTLAFSRPIGLRLHGNNMRGMPQKSFRIYFQNQNGRRSNLRYPLFGFEGNREYESVILRNGGDLNTFLRDRLAGRLVTEGSNVTAQRSRPVVVYLNGKYWGIYYLYERFDETYFSEKFRVKSSALSIIEVPLTNFEARGQVIPNTKNSTADAKKYNRLLADTRQCDYCGNYNTLNRFLDMDNLIDYYIFELYFNNVDWPYNNAKAWRYTTDEFSPEADAIAELDGRFRWLFFDLDASLGSTKDNPEGMIDSARNDPYGKLIDQGFPFGNIFNNSTFRENYQERVETLIQTTLNSSNMLKIADELAAEIRPEIPRHLEKWNDENAAWDSIRIRSLEDWEKEVELLKIYLRERPEGFSGRTYDFFNKIE